MTSKGFTGKKGPRENIKRLYLEAKLLTDNGQTIVEACRVVGLSVSSYIKARKYSNRL